jgi:putative transposase
MRELVLDNGREFHSESLEQVCYSLGIDMHYAPRKVAWFKGKIERFFRTLNEGVAHGKPGTTFSNIPERGDYDSQKHAVVRFSTLKKMLRLWIADIYHQEIHSSLQKTPTQMWTANISPEDIEIPKSLNDLEVVMGRVFARTLDHSGIEFEGLHYNSPELRELRRREGAKLKVQIRVNESNIGTIFVLSPRTSEPYSVTASEFEYADGLSLWQHEVISKWNRQNADADEGEPDRLRAREKMDRMVHDDSALKRNRSSKRVARYREASEEASVKTAGSKMKLFQPDALANASGSNRTARSGDHPATHVCDLMHLVEEDLDAGVPDFIPEYKKRYECE